MKTSELIKILKKNGCHIIRHGSNHDIWFCPKTNLQFAVPRHKGEIKFGTARNILKNAGTNQKEA
ncbi:MAG: type II toxin-antitoxin system HicA family toxin [Lachnospiraceae bacterium]|nr:type II toxin-antitoxin system HicA family toxin [Lachnospiraceae bacterium]